MYQDGVLTAVLFTYVLIILWGAFRASDCMYWSWKICALPFEHKMVNTHIVRIAHSILSWYMRLEHQNYNGWKGLTSSGHQSWLSFLPIHFCWAHHQCVRYKRFTIFCFQYFSWLWLYLYFSRFFCGGAGTDTLLLCQEQQWKSWMASVQLCQMCMLFCRMFCGSRGFMMNCAKSMTKTEQDKRWEKTHLLTFHHFKVGRLVVLSS